MNSVWTQWLPWTVNPFNKVTGTFIDLFIAFKATFWPNIRIPIVSGITDVIIRTQPGIFQDHSLFGRSKPSWQRCGSFARAENENHIEPVMASSGFYPISQARRNSAKLVTGSFFGPQKILREATYIWLRKTKSEVLAKINPCCLLVMPKVILEWQWWFYLLRLAVPMKFQNERTNTEQHQWQDYEVF